MQKSRSIQLHIPTPCHEDWDKMTANEKGRFCDQCQKTVIDFTNWSDADLFRFFEKRPASVCGRFFNTQLYQDIHLPPQPASRLYRIAIACSLTLMFTQLPETHAMVRQQTEMFSQEWDGDDKEDKIGTGGVRGKVTDEQGKPMQGVKVMIVKDDKNIAAAITDNEGKYHISGISSGSYYVFAKQGSDVSSREIKVTSDANTTVNMTLSHYEMISSGMVAVPEETRGEVQPVHATDKKDNTPVKKGKIKVGK